MRHRDRLSRMFIRSKSSDWSKLEIGSTRAVLGQISEDSEVGSAILNLTPIIPEDSLSARSYQGNSLLDTAWGMFGDPNLRDSHLKGL